MISIKAHCEWWCRWNCDLRVINAQKKGIFCCTESVATTPKSCDHMPTTSLWGVAAKWPTQAPKTKLILLPKRPTRIQLYQFEPARQDFEGVPVFHGVCEIALTEVLATQMGVMQCSKKVGSFELYKFNHCRSIAQELMHWGHLQIVTVRSNTVGWHC